MYTYVCIHTYVCMRVCLHVFRCLLGAWGRACRSGRAPGPQTRAPSGERSSWRYAVTCISGQHFLVLKPVRRTMCDRSLHGGKMKLHKLCIRAYKAYPNTHKACTYTYKTTDTDVHGRAEGRKRQVSDAHDHTHTYTHIHTHTAGRQRQVSDAHHRLRKLQRLPVCTLTHTHT